MPLLSTECYVKRAHPQCVDIAIWKIISAQYDHLETDVRSARSGMDAFDRLEVRSAQNKRKLRNAAGRPATYSALPPYLPLALIS
jgi:hypothetical protein